MQAVCERSLDTYTWFQIISNSNTCYSTSFIKQTNWSALLPSRLLGHRNVLDRLRGAASSAQVWCSQRHTNSFPQWKDMLMSHWADGGLECRWTCGGRRMDGGSTPSPLLRLSNSSLFPLSTPFLYLLNLWQSNASEMAIVKSETVPIGRMWKSCGAGWDWSNWPPR